MQQYTNSNRVMEFGNHFKNKVRLARRTFLLIAIFCINIAYSFAQDIITLKSGNEIQALVQEIGDVDVKYKKFDNPNGPSYTLKKSEIFMIKYDNGSKDVFADNVATDASPAKTPPSVQSQDKKENSPKKVKDMPGNLPLSAFAGIPLGGYMGSLTFEGTNRTIYSTDTYVEFIRENCPEAYDFFKSRRNRYRMSNAFMFIGGGVMLSAVVLQYNNSTSTDFIPYIGLAGGVAAIVGCIGTIVNMNYEIKSVSIYNQKCTNKQTSALSLNFGVTRSGGIGCTFNF